MVDVKFTSCLGMNNVLDPARLVYKPDSGDWEAALLLNVDLDATGRPTRRRGFSSLQVGSWHSLWSNGRIGYVVNELTLYEVGASGVLRSIKTDMAVGFPVSFLDVDGTIYWCNGVQNGKIVDGENKGWAGNYPHPSTVRIISDPPVGHLIEYHAGRIYIAQDNVVYFTEGAGLYDFVCMGDGYLPFFDSKIRMLRAVDDGLYVGTDAGVQFVSGMDPSKFQYRKVSDSAPVMGTDVTVLANIINQQANGYAAVWSATDGVYTGMSGGNADNITRKKLRLPAASRGAGLLYDNKYVALLAP